MSEAPTIATERLALRPFDEADADSVGFYADPDVMRYIPRGPWPKEGVRDGFMRMVASRREQWRTLGMGMWAVTLRETGAVIGHCGLQPLQDSAEIEVFWLLDKPHWNAGIATEAAKAALRFGFEQATLPRIVAIAMPENIASRRVMEKAGMRFVGEATHYGLRCIKYERTRADHEKEQEGT